MKHNIFFLKKFVVVSLLALLLTFNMLPVYSTYSIEETIQVNAVNLNSIFEITVEAEPETKVGIEILYADASVPPTSNDSITLMSTFAYVGQMTTDLEGKAVFTYVPKRRVNIQFVQVMQLRIYL